MLKIIKSVQGNPMAGHGKILLTSGEYRKVATKGGKPSLAHKVGHLLKGEAYKLDGETYYILLLK